MASSSPDVRVKLSAEGVGEVVGALKKIAAQSKKSGDEGAQGFKNLNSVLGNTKKLIAGIGIAFGGREIVRWIGDALEATDVASKMARSIGTSVENLSALNMVATTSGASLDKMRPAFSTMIRYIGEVRAGTPDAVAAFRDMNVELDDLEGKDAVEIFAHLAKALMAIPDPLERGRLSMLLFSESAVDLLPTMEALADEGFEAVIERATELGILIRTDTAQAVEQLNTEVDLLKLQWQALAREFAVGVVPEMTKAAQSLTGEMGDAGKAARELGEDVGGTVNFLGKLVGTLNDLFLAPIDISLTRQRKLWRAWMAQFRGDMDEARRLRQEAIDESSAAYPSANLRIKTRWITPRPPMEYGGGGGGGGGGGAGGGFDELPGGDPAKLETRLAQARAAAIDRELALIKTRATLMNKEEQRQFNLGLQGIETYYADRQNIIDVAYAEQVAAYKEKESLLVSETDVARRETEAAKIAADREQASKEHEDASAAIAYEKGMTTIALAQQHMAIERAILAAQGRTAEIAQLAIEDQIAKADLLYRKEGRSDADREARLARLREALESVALFDEIKREAGAAMQELALARADINAQVAEHMMSEMQGETELLALETERLATLQAIADAMLAAAEATGDATKIAQAKDYAQGIREIGYAVETSTDALGDFADTALEAGESALADFLETGLQGTKGLADAFRAMGASVIATIRRMAAEMMAAQIFKWLGGAFGGGGEVQGPPVAPGKAGGGPIHGPGTGTSDSVPIWASVGEHVVKASVASQPGIRAHLDQLNREGARALTGIYGMRNLPRFAAGGLVSGAAMLSPDQGTGGNLSGRLEIGLAHGLILEAMRSREGQQITVSTVTENRHQVRSGLGGV